MKKIKIIASALILVFVISGCIATVPHPKTGNPIKVPNYLVGKISFDLTIEYIYEGESEDLGSLILESFQNAGMSIDVSSFNPFFGKSEAPLMVGNLLGKYAPTYSKLTFSLLKGNKFRISLTPSMGSPDNPTYEFVLTEHHKLYKEKFDNILNPIDFKSSGN
tara:strand:- start:565 stop:1053 length:489 start_codon:yes stop_codon:yes gene_type:complete